MPSAFSAVLLLCVRTSHSLLLQQGSVRPMQTQPRRAPPILLFGGGGVPEVPFAASYKPGEIAALWSALKSCYGNEALARQAVEQNNQVLCPLYASPALLSQSKNALVAILGKEEALEIMQKNPAVLTCGAPGLKASDPDEIRKAANARKFLDAFATPQGFGVFVVAILLLNVVYRVVTQ